LSEALGGSEGNEISHIGWKTTRIVAISPTPASTLSQFT
jgi:hypothetical protein